MLLKASSECQKGFLRLGFFFPYLEQKVASPFVILFAFWGNHMHNFRLDLQKESVVQGFMLSFIFLLYDQLQLVVDETDLIF